MSDVAAWRAVAEAATTGPWDYNGYSAVFSGPMVEADDGFWTEERLADGHTYDHRVGQICPACGERPAVYDERAKPEVRGQRYGTYWDCAHNKEAYDVEPCVASVPAQYGDTATGRHAKDADHIATFDPPTVLAILARLEAAESKVARVEALIPTSPPADANGMVNHGTYGHSAGLQCDECTGYPHTSCVSTYDLREAVAYRTEAAG